MERPDLAVGDNRHRPADPGQRQRLGQQPVADDDVIAAAGAAYRQHVAQPTGQRRGDIAGHLLRRAAVGRHRAEAGVGGGALLQESLDAALGVGRVEQRPLGVVAGHAGHDRLRRGGQAEDGAGSAQRGGVVGVEHQPAAGGDDQPAPPGQLPGHGRLPRTEARLTVVAEDVGDGPAGAGDDQLVRIHKGAPQPPGQQTADGCLARAHETGQDYVLVYHVSLARKSSRQGAKGQRRKEELFLFSLCAFA